MNTIGQDERKDKEFCCPKCRFKVRYQEKITSQKKTWSDIMLEFIIEPADITAPAKSFIEYLESNYQSPKPINKYAKPIKKQQ